MIRRSDATENLAGVRHVAMNLATNEKTLKAGIKRKWLKVALSPDYLSRVPCGTRAFVILPIEILTKRGYYVP